MNKAKAYASGLAASIGATALVLSSQPIDHLGVQYINQLQWANIVMAVLASYGIVWYVPNKDTKNGPSIVDEPDTTSEPAATLPVSDAGRHRADTTTLTKVEVP